MGAFAAAQKDGEVAGEARARRHLHDHPDDDDRARARERQEEDVAPDQLARIARSRESLAVRAVSCPLRPIHPPPVERAET